MKSTFWVLLMLAGCGGGTVATPTPSPTPFPQTAFQPQALKPSTVPRNGAVLFGDSVFGRMDVSFWFAGQTVYNGGRFGLRTDELLPVLGKVLDGTEVCHGLAGDPQFPLTCAPLPQPPSHLVVFAGWNDLTQARIDNTVLSLRQIADQANGQGVRVTVLVIYPFDVAHPASWMTPPYTFYDQWRVPIDQGIRDTLNVEVIDVGMPMQDYTLDGIHPNDAGYQRIAVSLTNL